MNLTCFRVAIGILLVAFSASLTLAQSVIGQGDFQFEVKHRVNAHGDEFNALAVGSDRQRLFVGTEKGAVIIWNVAGNRLEKTLHQPSGIHLVGVLSDPRELIAASSNHVNPKNALVRKWNVETGTFVDLPGLESNSQVMALATDTQARLIAAANETGTVIVWDSQTNKQLARWQIIGVPTALALLGHDLYLATANITSPENVVGEGSIVKLNVDDQNRRPTDISRVAGRLWSSLDASPDRRLLTGTYQQGVYGNEKSVVLDPVSKAELANSEGSALVWLDVSKLLVFEWMDPVQIVQISRRAPAKVIRKFERFQADTPGRAFDLTGHVSNAAGSKVWATYSKGPGLLEFDLATSKIKTLIGGPSGVYGVSVDTQDGQTGDLLTGGADGYVRLWNLADISLIKEYKVGKPNSYVSEVHLVPGSRRAIVAVHAMPKEFEQPGPGEIIGLDLETGQQKKLFDLLHWRAQVAVVDNAIVYPEGNRVKFRNLDGSAIARELTTDGFIGITAVSPNKRWLAVIDETKKLTVFDLKSEQKKTMTIDPAESGTVVVTDDGRYVYNIAQEGALTYWDLDTGKATEIVLAKIREMHSRVDFMTVANDDRWLVTAGNHHDVGIFDRATGRLVFYMQVGGAVFFVEKVWLKGKRMIVTTDTGVMYDGVFLQ
jgi:WD40 repeat protein